MHLQRQLKFISIFPLLRTGCLRNCRSLSITSTVSTLRTPWTEQEDSLIWEHRSAGKSVAEIQSQFLPHRSLMAVYGRLHRISNESNLKTGKWNKEEEEYLIQKVKHIMSSGKPVRWKDLAMNLGRSSRTVRDRWRNKLNPEINHKPFDENELLIMNQWLASRGLEAPPASPSPYRNVKELAESLNRSEKRVYGHLLALLKSQTGSG